MAERRAVRRTRPRQQRDDEPVEEADEEVTDEADEADEEPDDELADEPDDELAEEPDDELADEPDEELDEEPDDEPEGEEPRHSRPRGDGIKPAKAGQLAMRQIAELTGKQPEGVTGVQRGDEGWIVGVEVVEDRRVPSSSDILATYETEVDTDGELVSYRRVKRYLRGRGDSEDA